MINLDYGGISERVCLQDFCSPYFAPARATLQIVSRNNFAGDISAKIIGMRPKQMAVVATRDPLNDGHIRTARDRLSNKVAFVWKIRSHVTFAER